MPRRHPPEDEDRDGGPDWDDADEDAPDWGDSVGPDDDEPAVSCPYCRREIPEDVARCPYCENFVSAEDAPPERKRWWIVMGTLLALYACYRWIVLG